jgi:Fe2+ transport system protein B
MSDVLEMLNDREDSKIEEKVKEKKVEELDEPELSDVEDVEDDDDWDEFDEDDEEAQAALKAEIARQTLQAEQDRAENETLKHLEQQNLAVFICILLTIGLLVTYFASRFIASRKAAAEEAKLEELRNLPRYADLVGA